MFRFQKHSEAQFFSKIKVATDFANTMRIYAMRFLSKVVFFKKIFILAKQLMKIILALGCMSIFAFQTACTKINPGAGAVMGAGVGAGGAALANASAPVVVGAGMAGGALGYYLATLKHAASPIEQVGGQVYQVGQYVGIEIPTDDLFEENSADLYPNASGILDALVNIVNRFPNHNILISGNTSGFYKSQYEQSLSQARAREIAAYLWSHGIDEFQSDSNHIRTLQYVGYGDYFKVASDLTNSGIRQNSRVQITLYPSQSDLVPGRKNDIAFENPGALHDENKILNYRNYKGE